MKKYGIIGKNISYSFSNKYFTDKFEKEGLSNCAHFVYDLQDISEIEKVLSDKELRGLNVTIPYKEKVIPYLDELDEVSAEIGAVNTIRISPDGHTTGYNTDAFGFHKSLVPFLELHHDKALILGTGGASKAIAYVLKKLGIEYRFVCRNPQDKPGHINYGELNPNVLKNFPLIINCTPVGTFPSIEQAPDIPYEHLSDKNLLYELIYNPTETLFLKKGHEKGAVTVNGMSMLLLQAEKSWEFWQ